MATVSQKALTANVATLTVATPHYLRAGDAVVVALVPADATFDGPQTLSAVGANSISFAKVAANVGVTACNAGSVAVASREGAIRAQLRAIAFALAGTPFPIAQIPIGVKNFAITDHFLKQLLSTGPWLVISPAKPKHSMTTGTREIEVRCHVWFGADKDADFDYTAIEDLVLKKLLPALANEDNYTLCGPPVGDIDVELPELDESVQPLTGKYTLTLNFKGC